MGWEDVIRMEFVGVIVGGLLVIVANVVVEVLRARGERSLDMVKRADDRRLGRDQFQRETLVKLQDATFDLMVSVMRVYAAHKRRSDDGEEWGGPVPSEIDAEGVRSLVAVQIQRSRVADDKLREVAQQFSDACRTVVAATDNGTADNSLVIVRDLEATIAARSGELIRATFQPT
jgi:hypothetical protein